MKTRPKKKRDIIIKEVIETMALDRIEWRKEYMWPTLTNFVENP